MFTVLHLFWWMNRLSLKWRPKHELRTHEYSWNLLLHLHANIHTHVCAPHMYALLILSRGFCYSSVEEILHLSKNHLLLSWFFLRLQSHMNRAVNGLNRDVDLSVCQLFHSHDVVVLSLFLCSLGELKSSTTPWTQTLWESTSWTISSRRSRIYALTCKLFPLMLTHRNLPRSAMSCPTPVFLLSLCLSPSLPARPPW